MKNQLHEIPIVTSAGEFLARYSKKGLVNLDFPKVDLSVNPAKRQRRPTKMPGWHKLTSSSLKSILAGRAPQQLPPLDLTGTDFQKSVWRALQKISRGKTKSYGEIARTIGRPKAVRAVGGACGANPVPVLIPCHRVLAADGKIGGFSGGLDWKRALLACEGVKV
ncbi:MAG: methylated-DNA--[protein]-cysteine S-methyltransferase [Verrucomicrobiae bacterium]